MTDPKEPKRRLIHETREERTYEEIPEDEAEMGADDELGENEMGDGEDGQQAIAQNPSPRKRGPNTAGRRIR